MRRVLFDFDPPDDGSRYVKMFQWLETPEGLFECSFQDLKSSYI